MTTETTLTSGSIAPSAETPAATPIEAMDRRADSIIRKWSFGSLVGNLLPPPLDSVLVAAAFARMGARLAQVYGIRMSRHELRAMSRAILKGISGVVLAGKIGTDLFKWVPGMNLWVALLIQPPIVAAIGYSVGQSFKSYYHLRCTEGRELSPQQLQETASSALRGRIGR